MHSGPEGEFDGQFTSLDNDDESSTVLGSAEEDVFGPACDATPTRRSVGASAKEDYTLRLPALPTSQSSPPSTEPPSTDMDPTEENLRRAAAKRGWLEAEKSRREARIQELYDELSELWMRFDVPEEEMEAFVMDHRGSTMSVLEAVSAQKQSNLARIMRLMRMCLPARLRAPSTTPSSTRCASSKPNTWRSSFPKLAKRSPCSGTNSSSPPPSVHIPSPHFSKPRVRARTSSWQRTNWRSST